jgi:hypothetical protein
LEREQLGDEFVTSEIRSQSGLMNGCGCIFSSARNKEKWKGDLKEYYTLMEKAI